MVVAHVENRRVGRRLPEKDEVGVGYRVTFAREVHGEGRYDVTRGTSGPGEACPAPFFRASPDFGPPPPRFIRHLPRGVLGEELDVLVDFPLIGSVRVLATRFLIASSSDSALRVVREFMVISCIDLLHYPIGRPAPGVAS